MSYQRNELVKVNLRVYKSLSGYSGQAADYFVAVTGPGLQLGYGEINKAPRCKRVRNNLWLKEIWLPKNSNINFKFVVVKSSTNITIDVETVQPHRLFIGQRAIEADTRYNQTGIVIKEDGPQLRKPIGREVNERPKMQKFRNDMTKMANTKGTEEDVSLKMKQMGDKSLNIAHVADKSFTMTSMTEQNLKMTHEADESVKMIHEADENLKMSHEADESVKMTHEVDERVKMTHEADENLKMTHEADESVKMTHETDENLKMTNVVKKSLKGTGEPPKLTELECGSIKMGKENDGLLRIKKQEAIRESVQIRHTSENARNTTGETSTSTGFPFNGKKFILSAAGVVMASCAGYFFFAY